MLSDPSTGKIRLEVLRRSSVVIGRQHVGKNGLAESSRTNYEGEKRAALFKHRDELRFIDIGKVKLSERGERGLPIGSLLECVRHVLWESSKIEYKFILSAKCRDISHPQGERTSKDLLEFRLPSTL